MELGVAMLLSSVYLDGNGSDINTRAHPIKGAYWFQLPFLSSGVLGPGWWWSAGLVCANRDDMHVGGF